MYIVDLLLHYILIYSETENQMDNNFVPVAGGTLSTVVKVNMNTFSKLFTALSGSEMLIVATVTPSGMTVGGGVITKSAAAVAAIRLAGMLLLGATVAVPLTRMSPMEPYRLQTVIEACERV